MPRTWRTENIFDFDGAGLEASPWIRHIAEVTHRHGVPAVLNEVGYQLTGELLTVMHDYSTVRRWCSVASTARPTGPRLAVPC